MHTLVAFDISSKELPEQIKTFVKDLNWLRDEGFIDFVEEEDSGEVRLVPREITQCKKKTT